MFKTGIYNLTQLTNKNINSFLNKKKTIAVNLFREVGLSGLSNKEQLEESIMKRFNMKNGSHRKTHGTRFEDFDADALRQIKKFFSPDDLLNLHDTAVSDGRTACDFFIKTKRFFKRLNYHATDKDTHVKIIKSKKFPQNKIIRDENKNVLQIIFPPFVFNIPKKENPLLYPINRLILSILKNKKWLKKLMKLEEVTEERMNLFCNRALKLEREEPGFSLGAYDMTKEMKSGYDVIRVMNILEKNNFKKEAAENIINNLKNKLNDPGILIIGSNNNAGSPVNGNILLKKKGKINILSESGKGIPYKEFFLNKEKAPVKEQKTETDLNTSTN